MMSDKGNGHKFSYTSMFKASVSKNINYIILIYTWLLSDWLTKHSYNVEER